MVVELYEKKIIEVASNDTVRIGAYAGIPTMCNGSSGDYPESITHTEDYKIHKLKQVVSIEGMSDELYESYIRAGFEHSPRVHGAPKHLVHTKNICVLNEDISNILDNSVDIIQLEYTIRCTKKVKEILTIRCVEKNKIIKKLKDRNWWERLTRKYE